MNKSIGRERHSMFSKALASLLIQEEHEPKVRPDLQQHRHRGLSHQGRVLYQVLNGLREIFKFKCL